MSDEWETPPELFKYLDSRFNFTIDAAAQDHNKKLDIFSNDCFNTDFTGHRVFCNPPYSKAKEFALFFRDQWVNYSVPSLLLLPVRTDRIWWHDVARKGRFEWYIGRLKFSGSKNSAFMYSVNLIFGFSEVAKFKTINAGYFGGTYAKS